MLQYTLRYGPRNRKVHLRLTPEVGLEVIVPVGFDPARIPEILRHHQRWLAKAQQQPAPDPVPLQIDLVAIAACWPVIYRPVPRPRIQAEGLVVRDVAQLRRWLAQQARIHLGPWLARLSQETGLGFDHLSIRHQRSRWGSCSGRAGFRISLNCCLLLLPAPLVRYVLIHELCHTVHLNHSPAFWQLVERYEPDYAQIKRQLRQHHIPTWALLKS